MALYIFFSTNLCASQSETCWWPCSDTSEDITRIHDIVPKTPKHPIFNEKGSKVFAPNTSNFPLTIHLVQRKLKCPCVVDLILLKFTRYKFEWMCVFTCVQRLWFSHQSRTWSLWNRQRMVIKASRERNKSYADKSSVHAVCPHSSFYVRLQCNIHSSRKQNIINKRSLTKLYNKGKPNRQTDTHSPFLLFTYYPQSTEMT